MREIRGKTMLVTGGAGFIGSNLVGRLLSEGSRVVVYDNMSSGREEFLKPFQSNDDFRLVKADLLDPDSVKAAVKESGASAIWHLAANPDIGRGTKQTDLDLRQGTVATYNALEAARENGVKDFIFSSTSAVYGVAKRLPTPEDYGPLLPISLYGASKLACEGLITAFGGLFGINYFIFRFANVTGRNSTHGVVLDFVKKLRSNPSELLVLGNGKQSKSYIDVGDCVDGMVYAYKNSESGENLFNLTAKDTISVEEIAKMVASRVSEGAMIKYTGTEQGWPGDVTRTFLDGSKISDLGWKPRYDSRGAISNTLDFMLGDRTS